MRAQDVSWCCVAVSRLHTSPPFQIAFPLRLYQSPQVNFRTAEINRDWSDADKIDLLRTMLRIRRFEGKALNRYCAGTMGGWLFTSVGQESIAACARSIMGPWDHTISGCRGLGHAIAAGISMESCMAEFYGRLTGSSRGKAGAFSFYAPHLRHWGCHALAGTQTPLAAGLAFALKHRQELGAAVCFLGDGATNAGAYHESLNLAGLFDLPVVYVIENNNYAMGTSVARSSRFRECLARRAEGYDIQWDHFSDADPYEIRARLHTAFQRARLEQRPTVVEISTYRYYGFSVADANHKKYRTPEEIEWHKARDPLNNWKNLLIQEQVITESQAEAMTEELKAEADDAAHAAEAADLPGIEDIRTNVYWESDHNTQPSRTGRHFFDP
jgi:pyruvate dehydrogenase E1 component alpha subunit